MPEEFRGSAATIRLPFLPRLTGRIVESVETTERFLGFPPHDRRPRGGKKLLRHFAARCRAEVWQAAFEGYSYHGIFDDFEVSRLADADGGALGRHFQIQPLEREGRRSAVDPRRAAHRGGGGVHRRRAGCGVALAPVSAEGGGRPLSARGVTRLHFSGQRAPAVLGDDARPGMTMGPHGIQMNRHNTW